MSAEKPSVKEAIAILDDDEVNEVVQAALGEIQVEGKEDERLQHAIADAMKLFMRCQRELGVVPLLRISATATVGWDKPELFEALKTVAKTSGEPYLITHDNNARVDNISFYRKWADIPPDAKRCLCHQ